MTWLYFIKEEEIISTYIFIPGYINICEGFINYNDEYVKNKIKEKKKINGKYCAIPNYVRQLLTDLDLISLNETIWLYDIVDSNQLYLLD